MISQASVSGKGCIVVVIPVGCVRRYVQIHEGVGFTAVVIRCDRVRTVWRALAMHGSNLNEWHCNGINVRSRSDRLGLVDIGGILEFVFDLRV